MKQFYFWVIMLFCTFNVVAQSTANYVFSTNTTSSLALDANGNTVDMSTGTTQLVAPSIDQGASVVSPIGFTYYLMGNYFTQFSASSNGLLQLGGTAVSSGNYVASGGTSSLPKLSAFAGDLQTGSLGKVHYKVVGTAPNRCLVVEYLNMNLYYSSGIFSNDATYQIRLYESSGVIEYVYGTMTVSSISGFPSDSTPSIGFSSGTANNTFGSVTFAAHTYNTTTSFTENPASATGAISQLTSAANGSRRAYLFTPPSVITTDPTTLTFTAVGSSTITPNWVDNSTNETNFIVTRATDAAFTTGLVASIVSSTTSAGTGTTYTLAQTGLNPNTIYYYRVQSSVEGGASAGVTGSQSTNPPGTFTSVATGNWNSSATWDAASVPSSVDNVIISAGNVVAIDATGLSAGNVTVDGTLNYGATPTSFTVNGNLTVSNTGLISVFNGTTGKTLIVRGDLTNNGAINLSVGTTTAGNLTLNGTLVQTVSGIGTFTNGFIRNLTFGNTNTATPNIVWSINNIRIAYDLNLTGARVNLGTNKLTFGNNAAANTLTAPVGTGFLSGAKFSRWWTTAGTGTAFTAGTDPSNSTSRYPFLSSTGVSRTMYISRSSSTTTGNTAGELAVTFNDAATTTTGLTITDGTYTITDRNNSNWTVTAESGYVYASGTHLVSLIANNAYSGNNAINGNSRVMLASSTVGGTHQNGTTTPGAQRTGLTTAQLTAGALYIGIAAGDINLPCTGTPTSGTIPASVTACLGTSAGAIVATGASGLLPGISFQWEESDDNGVADSWANAVGGSGATTATFTTPAINTTIYYRLKTTCAGSGLSSFTNVSTVTTAVCTFNTTFSTGAAYTSIMPANGGSGLAFPGWRNADGDDNASTVVSLAGTTFKYQGQAVTGFQACSNGWMTFNANNDNYTWGNTLTTATSTNNTASVSKPLNLILAPFWDDLVFTGQSFANRDASLRYLVSGTLGSGSAVITVEWAGVERFNIPGPNLNFQVKLYESDNHIEYIYGNFIGFDGTVTSAYSYSIGLNGTNPAGTTAVDRFVQQTPNENHFSATSQTNQIIMPTCNSMITFTPGTYTGLTAAPAPVVPTNNDSAGAIALSVGSTPPTSLCGTYYTSRNATDSGAGLPTCLATAATAGSQDDDVWFTFNTSALTSYTIKLLSSPLYDGVIQLLDSTLTPVSCQNSATAGLTETINATGLTPSSTYYLRVFHNGTAVGSSAGEFSIYINEVISPPTNDNIAGATPLTVTTACTPTSSQLPNTLAATASPTLPAPTLTATVADDDVWYSFVAPSDETEITVQSGAGYNAAVQILSSSDNTATGTLQELLNLNNTSTAGAEVAFGALTPGNTYFLRIYHAASGAGTGNFTVCVKQLLPCTQTTTWNGTAWSPFTPRATQKAVIAGNYSSSTNFSACSLEITGTSVVTIPSGTNVTITNEVTVASEASLTFSNNANLLQTGGTTNNNVGNVTINRTTNSLMLLDYVMWGSPVADQQLQAFSPNTLSNRFYSYNNATNLYSNETATSNFADAKGYLIRLPNDHPTTPTTWTGSFVGKPNNGDYSFTPAVGFNSVANPYPSTLSMASFVADNPTITGTLYFWRKTNSLTNLPGYCSWNNGTYVSNGQPGAISDAAGNDMLQVGQGFIVNATATTGVLFRNTQRTANTAGQTYRSASTETTSSPVATDEKHRIWLNLTSANGSFSQTAFGYMSNATNGLDQYDGLSFNDGNVSLTSLIADQKHVIQGKALPFAATDLVPLNYKVNQAGNYTIAIDNVDGLFSSNGQAIYLRDALLNTETNLTTTSYSFASVQGEFNNRFTIAYMPNQALVNDEFTENSVVIYKNDNQIVVNSGNATMQSVKVFDLTGRLLVNKKDINATSTTLSVNAKNQVILVQVKDTNGSVVTKKVIN